VDKFVGLNDQFGDVCPVVRLDERGYERQLEHAIRDLWERADELRPGLVRAAEQQIELSRAAYRRFRTTVESKAAGPREFIHVA
jgi:hypothetical protein